MYTGTVLYDEHDLPGTFTEQVGTGREKHKTTFGYDDENRVNCLTYDGSNPLHHFPGVPHTLACFPGDANPGRQIRGAIDDNVIVGCAGGSIAGIFGGAGGGIAGGVIYACCTDC